MPHGDNATVNRKILYSKHFLLTRHSLAKLDQEKSCSVGDQYPFRTASPHPLLVLPSLSVLLYFLQEYTFFAWCCSFQTN